MAWPETTPPSATDVVYLERTSLLTPQQMSSYLAAHSRFRVVFDGVQMRAWFDGTLIYDGSVPADWAAAIKARI